METIKELKFDSKNDWMDYLNFSKPVMSTAKKSASCNIKSSPGWFIISKDIIKPLLKKRSKVLKRIRHNSFWQEQAIKMTKRYRTGEIKVDRTFS